MKMSQIQNKGNCAKFQHFRQYIYKINALAINSRLFTDYVCMWELDAVKGLDIVSWSRLSTSHQSAVMVSLGILKW